MNIEDIYMYMYIYISFYDVKHFVYMLIHMLIVLIIKVQRNYPIY